MSYACGPADWIDLAVGRLEDAKRSLRECDRLRQGCDICEELRQARRCLNKALIYDAYRLIHPYDVEVALGLVPDDEYWFTADSVYRLADLIDRPIANEMGESCDL